MEIYNENNELKNMSETKGLIFNIQRFSLHDGPGIRTTIFLKGCPLKCLWCHNPEGINQSKELLYKSFSCMHCGRCIEICPNNIFSLTDNQLFINRNDCDLCELCIEKCPTKSIEICGRPISVSELINEVMTDKEFYLSSKGGITISGGEPMMQFTFLKQLIIELKKHNIHVCLDTSGYAKRDKFREILDLIDMVLFDVKTLDNERHKRLTGVSNVLILNNMKECSNSNIDIIIRTPIIIGYNFIDIENELREHLKYLMEMGFKNFEMIPYHSFGEQKYKMLGKPYRIKIDSSKSDIIGETVGDLNREFEVNIKLSYPILT